MLRLTRTETALGGLVLVSVLGLGGAFAHGTGAVGAGVETSQGTTVERSTGIPAAVTLPSTTIAAASGPHTRKRETREQAPPTTRQPAAEGRVVPGLPTRIQIPALGVDASVDSVGVTDGALDIPHDIQRVGWDEETVLPGSPAGTSLLSGHLDDSNGNEGALHELASLDVGDRISLTTRRGTITYRVTAVREYPKTGMPASIVATTGNPRIAIVTCGGPLMKGADGLLHYRDNIVAWAAPAPTGH